MLHVPKRMKLNYWLDRSQMERKINEILFERKKQMNFNIVHIPYRHPRASIKLCNELISVSTLTIPLEGSSSVLNIM